MFNTVIIALIAPIEQFDIIRHCHTFTGSRQLELASPSDTMRAQHLESRLFAQVYMRPQLVEIVASVTVQKKFRS